MIELLLNKNIKTQIDNSDFYIVSMFKWYAVFNKSTDSYYVITTMNKKRVYLHRYLMKIVDSEYHIDHIDGNSLNNQKTNLRICNRSQNQCNRSKQSNNTSGYKGVIEDKRNNTWSIEIKYKNTKIKKYGFLNPDEAALFRDALAIKLHGDFAFTNFPKNKIPCLSDEEFNKLKEKEKCKRSSKYIGVYFEKNIQKWRSAISINRKTININPCCKSEIECALQRDEIAEQYNRTLNFPWYRTGNTIDSSLLQVRLLSLVP